MTTLWLLLIALASFAAFAAVGDLVSEEVRGRLDALPHAVLRLAARRLPDDLRAERLTEWEGELHEILRGAEALPVTRLWRGLRYAAGIVRAAPSIARALSVEDRAPNRRRSREWVRSGIRTTRDAIASLAAGLFVGYFGLTAFYAVFSIDVAALNGGGYAVATRIIFSVTAGVFFISLPIFIFSVKKAVARTAAQAASCAVVAAALDFAAIGYIEVGLSAGLFLIMAILAGCAVVGGLGVAWIAHRIRAIVCVRRLREQSAPVPS